MASNIDTVYHPRFHGGVHAYDGMNVIAEDFADALIKVRDKNTWHDKLLKLSVWSWATTRWEVVFEDTEGWPE
jgi:hypothetical protein